jgi:hypothetical protein
MKRLISPIIAIVAFVSMLILFTVPKRVLPKVQADVAENVCTLSTLNGPYGLVLTGTIVGVGPFSQVGIVNFDGAGHISAKETTSFVGAIIPRHPAFGTYTVNSDCTGSSSIGGHTADFVIVDGGDEQQLLVTDPGAVITGSFKKVFPGHNHHGD